MYFFKHIMTYYSEGIPERNKFENGFRGLLKYLISIFTEVPPGVQRLMKLQPVFSLIFSILCIVLMRRGLEFVPVVAIWAFITLIYINLRFFIMAKWEEKIAIKVNDFTMIFLISNCLFFITPLYYESSTLLSRNFLFIVLLLVLNVVINWYHLYKVLVIKKPIGGAIFYSLTFFSIYNLILPVLFGVSNSRSLVISEVISAVTLVVFIYPYLLRKKPKRFRLKFYLSILATLCMIWFARSFIPPSPMKISYAAVCSDVIGREPVDTFQTKDKLGKVFFFTSVFSPFGLAEGIEHKWYLNDSLIQTVNLGTVGGREKGFRTWSSHTVKEQKGMYRIEVWTKGGQFLGQGFFEKL